jgi:hypothetical protein
LEMVQNGLDKDPAFQQLVYLWQRTLEKRWCCPCCRPKVIKAARRLRVALRRVVTCKQKLPPTGPPLIRGDEPARLAHTPIYQRDVEEQLHLLTEPQFSNSALAIALATNILIVARVQEEEEVEPQETGPSAEHLAEKEAGIVRSKGVISTGGGDIGTGGPNSIVLKRQRRRLSPEELEKEPDTIDKKQLITYWLEGDSHLHLPFGRAPPGSTVPSRVPSPGSMARRGSASQLEAGEAERPGHAASAHSGIGGVAVLQVPVAAGQAGLKPLKVPRGGDAAQRAEVASGSAARAVTSRSKAPMSPAASTVRSLEEQGALLQSTLAEPANTRYDSVPSGTPSRHSTPVVTVSQFTGRTSAQGIEATLAPRTRPKFHDQNFGDNARDRQRLIRAAHRNLRKNKMPLPAGIEDLPAKVTNTGQGYSSGGSGSSNSSGGSKGDDYPRTGRHRKSTASGSKGHRGSQKYEDQRTGSAQRNGRSAGEGEPGVRGEPTSGDDGAGPSTRPGDIESRAASEMSRKGKTPIGGRLRGENYVPVPPGTGGDASPKSCEGSGRGEGSSGIRTPRGRGRPLQDGQRTASMTSQGSVAALTQSKETEIKEHG